MMKERTKVLIYKHERITKKNTIQMFPKEGSQGLQVHNVCLNKIKRWAAF